MSVSLDVLDFVSSGNSGSYCEAVCIYLPEGLKFVMHRARSRNSVDFEHELREFPSREELMRIFPAHYSPVSEWTRTDSGLGCGITEEIRSKAYVFYSGKKS